MKALAARLLRFGLVGGFASLLYYAIANWLTLVWQGKPLLSNLFAYTVCIVVSYALQRTVTFRSEGRVHVEAARFAMVSLLGLVLSSLITFASIRLLGVTPYLGYLLVLVTIPLFNYFLFSRFVFREKDPLSRTPTESSDCA